MKTKSAKAKGRRLQNYVANRLKEIFKDYSFKPALMGESGEDIKIYPDDFSFSFECKNQETLNIWKALEQAKTNAGSKVPVVVFKRNNSGVYATIPFEEFLKLLENKNERS